MKMLLCPPNHAANKWVELSALMDCPSGFRRMGIRRRDLSGCSGSTHSVFPCVTCVAGLSSQAALRVFCHVLSRSLVLGVLTGEKGRSCSWTLNRWFRVYGLREIERGREYRHRDGQSWKCLSSCRNISAADDHIHISIVSRGPIEDLTGNLTLQMPINPHLSNPHSKVQ